MKILSVDDHFVFRLGLKPLVAEIDPDAEIIEAGSCEEALAKIAADGAPDLILLDLLMPGMEAFDGLQAVQECAPEVPIVIMSMIESRQDVLHAIELGAQGYIPKSAPPAEILDALRAIIAGQVYLPPELVRKTSRAGRSIATVSASRPSAAKRLSQLTDRQREVVGLLGKGMTNAQIAASLGLSESTVRLHVSTILDKLNLNNRTQVALLAAQSSAEMGEIGEVEFNRI